VADVQVAVRLGRKRVITLGMPADVGAGREVGFDDGAQEIGVVLALGCFYRCSSDLKEWL
jgi:uncharacterized metal-binding protein